MAASFLDSQTPLTISLVAQIIDPNNRGHNNFNNNNNNHSDNHNNNNNNNSSSLNNNNSSPSSSSSRRDPQAPAKDSSKPQCSGLSPPSSPQ
jgi:hypothetical protein